MSSGSEGTAAGSALDNIEGVFDTYSKGIADGSVVGNIEGVIVGRS